LHYTTLVLMAILTSTDYTQQNQITNFYTTIGPDLKENLQKFWELKEFSSNSIFISQEQLCKDLFKFIHTRDNFDRYIVSLFLKQDAQVENSGRFPIKCATSIFKHRITSRMQLKFEVSISRVHENL